VAKDVAEYFRVKKERADKIIDKVVMTVKKWNVVANELGLPNSQIDARKKAFSNFK